MITSNYEFNLISENNSDGKIALDYSTQDHGIWKKVLIMDSIFEFYPSMEIIIPDDIGFLSDIMVVMEGMKFTAKLGEKTKSEYLEHDYVVQKNELIHAKTTTHLSGDVLLSFTSYYNLLDIKKSQAWKDTVSNIVKDLCKKGLKLPANKISDDRVEKTDGKDIWYQINETTEDFIKHKLVKVALSQNNSKSPYMSFINCSGEIYFSSIDKMFKQPAINKDNPYILSFDKDQSYGFQTIKNVYTIQGGLEINKVNYNKKTFYRKSDGKVNSGNSGDGEATKVSDHIIKGEGKVLFRKDLIDNDKATDFDDFGIYEDKDKQFYEGFVNSLFIDSTLYLRMEITVNFNYQAVSGKVVLLKIPSNIKEKSGYTKEYEGDWLITNSRHFFDVDAAPFTRLVIAKARINIDKAHPFYKKFLD